MCEVSGNKGLTFIEAQALMGRVRPGWRGGTRGEEERAVSLREIKRKSMDLERENG